MLLLPTRQRNCQLVKMKLNRKMKNPNHNENMSDKDFVFTDLGKQISPLIITFIPNKQLFFYTTLVVGAP